MRNMKMAQTLNAFDISFRAYSFAQPWLCLRRSLKEQADYLSIDSPITIQMKSDVVESANERESNRTRPLSPILKLLTEKWGLAVAYD